MNIEPFTLTTQLPFKFFNHFLLAGNTSSSSIGGPSVKKQATNEDVIFDMYSGLKPVPLLPLSTSSVLNPSLAAMQTAKTSVQLLEEICHKEGFQTPIYTLQTSTSKDQDGRDVTWFMCKVSDHFL